MKSSKNRWLVLSLLLALVSPMVWAAEVESEPTFFLKFKDKEIKFLRSELLARKDKTTVEVLDDPAYGGKKMTYTAVPLANLLKSFEIPEEGVILFQALDGYSSALPKKKLLQVESKENEEAIPYLAIEGSSHWPAINLAQGPQSAGPFYLVWKQRAGVPVSVEEWPYQLSGFNIKGSFKEAFPKIFPDSGLKSNHPVVRGMKVFTKNCFSCHTINQEGETSQGPDLNFPMNPTEYFSTSLLKKFIRDPQSLHAWPKAKMKGFDEKHLSNSDLDDLIAYLKHMVKRKIKL